MNVPKSELVVFGGNTLEWNEVSENADMAPSHFHRERSFDTKLISFGENEDLACTVWFEHGEVQMTGREDFRPILVWVTHIFRREGGKYKIIHRHGDRVADNREATNIFHR